MKQLHPYLQIYLKSNCKFKKVLKHYMNSKKQNKSNTQNAGGKVEFDNFIFEEFYDEEDERINIFIGKKHQCVYGIINKATPHLVWLEWFNYHQNCNLTQDLVKGEGTVNMMSTFIKYIKEYHPDIKIIKLSDKGEFICSNVSISLYKLYMLKYGTSFYEKFGFSLDNTNNPDIIIKHNKNIENSKTIKIDKEFIIKELKKILEVKDSLFKFYLTHQLIDDFASHLEDNELVREFLLRFRIPDTQCAIFEDFLNIIFGNYNLDTSIISLGAIYVKKIEKYKPSKKLTKKKTYL